jgi:short-subunit dehydrogenase
MELNFDAVLRLTEALLPILRRSAPSAIVNVASTAGRVSRANSGGVLPGFVVTEGFPQRELRDRALTRWMVSTPDNVAEAIFQAGPRGKAERCVPRPYGLAAAARVVVPRLVRWATGGATLTPETRDGEPGS